MVIIKPHYRLKFLLGGQKYLNLRFEYGVILNGSQTHNISLASSSVFEYGVILNGSQTHVKNSTNFKLFEYGVILNGSQRYRLLG